MKTKTINRRKKNIYLKFFIPWKAVIPCCIKACLNFFPKQESKKNVKNKLWSFRYLSKSYLRRFFLIFFFLLSVLTGGFLPIWLAILVLNKCFDLNRIKPRCTLWNSLLTSQCLLSTNVVLLLLSKQRATLIGWFFFALTLQIHLFVLGEKLNQQPLL